MSDPAASGFEFHLQFAFSRPLTQDDVAALTSRLPALISTSSPTSPPQSAKSLNTATLEDSQQLPTVASVTTAEEVLVRSRVHYLSTQRVYVAPDAPLPDELRSVWVRRIQEPLRIVLHNNVHSGSCIQEFMMAGKKRDQLKPFVVVTCGNKKVQKEVEKAIRSLDQLLSILKSSRIGFVALIGEASLSGHRMSDSLSVQSAVLSLEDPGGNEFFCGRRVKLANGNYCTLGGIITIDDAQYVLTVGHCFSWASSKTLSDRASVSAEPSTHEEDDEKSRIEPFWLDESDDESKSEDLDKPETLGNYRFASKADRGPNDIQNLKWRPFIHMEHCIMSTASKDDWAVLNIGMMPAKIVRDMKSVQNRNAEIFTELSGDEYDGKVYIRCGSTTYDGYLRTLPCSVHIETVTCDACLIVLDNPLPFGCSGSWVGRDNRLLGHIIATRKDVPWAYMIPIEQTLRSIKEAFSTLNVGLPASTPLLPLRPVDAIERRALASRPIKYSNITPQTMTPIKSKAQPNRSAAVIALIVSAISWTTALTPSATAFWTAIRGARFHSPETVINIIAIIFAISFVIGSVKIWTQNDPWSRRTGLQSQRLLAS